MRPKAFTLLELMLAIGVTAMLSGMLAAMMRAGFRAQRVIADAAGPSRCLLAATDYVVDALAATTAPNGVLAGTFVGEEAGDRDELTFHTIVNPYGSSWSDIVKVQFSLVEDADGHVNLVRTCTRNLLSPRTLEGEAEILCRDVAALDFRYFDGADWSDGWDSTDRGDLAPEAVEVVVILADDDAETDDDRPRCRRVVRLVAAMGREASQ